jgi:hypothetical protein
MIFERKRRVGSLNDIDCAQTRFDNPTSIPRLLSKTSQIGNVLPHLAPKARAEWIKGRKFVQNPGWTRAGRRLRRAGISITASPCGITSITARLV